MKHLFRACYGTVLLSCLGGPVHADLTSVGAPLSLSYQGDITYNGFEVSSFVGRGAILSGTLTSTSSETSTIAYDANFHEPPNVLRFTDVITNNSGQSWNGIQFHLGTTAGMFDHDFAVPAINSVVDPTGPSPVVTAITRWNNGNNGGVIDVSPAFLTITFNTAIPDGSTIAFQTSPLDLVSPGGSLELTLTPLLATTVPEPSTMVLAAAGASSLCLVCYSRRRLPRVRSST
jgi:hypothetical protein